MQCIHYGLPTGDERKTDRISDPQHPRFDRLIVDPHLGGMSGIDLKAQLTSVGVSIPMILMTASDEKEFDRLALQANGAIRMRKKVTALLDALGRAVH